MTGCSSHDCAVAPGTEPHPCRCGYEALATACREWRERANAALAACARWMNDAGYLWHEGGACEPAGDRMLRALGPTPTPPETEGAHG